MIRIIAPMVLLLLVFLVVKFVMDTFEYDRPRQVGRRDAKKIAQENANLWKLVNSVDAQAQADYTVTHAPLGAVISGEIAKTRRELNS